MEIRNGKLIISNAGGTASSGAKTYKASLPTTWINALKLNEKTGGLNFALTEKKL